MKVSLWPSHIVTARRHRSSGISRQQQPEGMNPASALPMSSTLPVVYASALGPRGSVVRVEPYGSSGWQKASAQFHATHQPRPLRCLRIRRPDRESAVRVELGGVHIEI
jgi:hypothetical protein